MLECSDCHSKFRYPNTQSNNYPRNCLKCRTDRTAANKKRFDEQRSCPQPVVVPVRNLKVGDVLDTIPDYVIRPEKIIDAFIKYSKD